MNRIWTALLTVPLGLAGCGGYSAPTGSQNPPPPAMMQNDINIVVGASQLTTAAFNPNPKVVSLGGSSSVTVRWVNKDISGGDYTSGSATIHNIASDNGAFPASASLGGNATYSATLTATGDYPYHCTIHPNMTGTVTVGQ
ncbi:MAG: plastocyanin/azurin family copper-binding protein [Gemmatimonadales bacterium]